MGRFFLLGRFGSTTVIEKARNHQKIDDRPPWAGPFRGGRWPSSHRFRRPPSPPHARGRGGPPGWRKPPSLPGRTVLTGPQEEERSGGKRIVELGNLGGRKNGPVSDTCSGARWGHLGHECRTGQPPPRGGGHEYGPKSTKMHSRMTVPASSVWRYKTRNEEKAPPLPPPPLRLEQGIGFRVRERWKTGNCHVVLFLFQHSPGARGGRVGPSVRPVNVHSAASPAATVRVSPRPSSPGVGGAGVGPRPGEG